VGLVEEIKEAASEVSEGEQRGEVEQAERVGDNLKKVLGLVDVLID